jgi:hypothetical protein
LIGIAVESNFLVLVGVTITLSWWWLGGHLRLMMMLFGFLLLQQLLHQPLVIVFVPSLLLLSVYHASLHFNSQFYFSMNFR